MPVKLNFENRSILRYLIKLEQKLYGFAVFLSWPLWSCPHERSLYRLQLNVYNLLITITKFYKPHLVMHCRLRLSLPSNEYKFIILLQSSFISQSQCNSSYILSTTVMHQVPAYLAYLQHRPLLTTYTKRRHCDSWAALQPVKCDFLTRKRVPKGAFTLRAIRRRTAPCGAVLRRTARIRRNRMRVK